jgi:hypothetical protein
MYQIHKQFIARATAYDDGNENARSHMRDEKWLSLPSCPWLRIDDTKPLDMQLDYLESKVTLAFGHQAEKH